MYAWIWRKLPFGLYGKLIGSVLLASTVGVLLWFWVFPAVEPALTPFDDVQVGDPGTGQDLDPGVGGGPAGVAPSPSFNPDDFAVPYETDEPTHSPSPSKRR